MHDKYRHAEPTICPTVAYALLSAGNLRCRGLSVLLADEAGLTIDGPHKTAPAVAVAPYNGSEKASSTGTD